MNTNVDDAVFRSCYSNHRDEPYDLRVPSVKFISPDRYGRCIRNEQQFSESDEEKRIRRKEQNRFDVAKHASKILLNLNQLRKNCQLCDVIFHVENQEYHAHMGIMIACSELCWRHYMRHEAHEGKHKLIIQGIKSSVFKTVMEYIYTGKLNYTNDEELEPLCEAASLLMMPELKDKLATARTNAQLDREDVQFNKENRNVYATYPNPGEKTSHTASDSHKDTKENMIPPVPASPDCTTTSPPSPLLFSHLHTQHTTISEQIAARTRFNNNILKLMVTRGVGEQSGVLSPNIFFPALPLSLYPSYNIMSRAFAGHKATGCSPQTMNHCRTLDQDCKDSKLYTMINRMPDEEDRASSSTSPTCSTSSDSGFESISSKDEQQSPKQEFHQNDSPVTLLTTNNEKKRKSSDASKRYACPLCDSRFNRPANLKTHMRIHSGEKPYTCKTCNASFVQVAHLRAHSLIHTGEKPYPCNICGTRFRHLQTLKSHKRIHTGEKPYSCGKCDVWFRHKSQLRLHLRSKHGVNTNTKKVYQKIPGLAGQLDISEHIKRSREEAC